jgi:hypothetical protein
VIVDLARPDRPAEVGRWWLPGTQHGDGSPPPVRHEAFDAGFRAHNINIYPGRPGRAYVGYLDAGAIILDISDAGSPTMVSRLDHSPPMPGFTHTVLPLLGNNLLAITDESVHDNAADFPKLLWFADVSHETSPLLISSAPLPPVAEFAHRGGRFGAHNLHENEPFAWSWRSEDIVFGSFFNAGVRLRRAQSVPAGRGGGLRAARAARLPHRRGPDQRRLCGRRRHRVCGGPQRGRSSSAPVRGHVVSGYRHRVQD